MYSISFKKIFNNGAFVCLFLFLQYMPQIIMYDSRFSSIDFICTVLKMLLILLMVFLIALTKDKNEKVCQPILIAIFTFFSTLMFSSIVNNESVVHTCSTFCQLIIFCIFVSKGLEHNYKILFKALFVVLFIIVFVNLGFMLVKPEGLFQTKYYHNAIHFMGPKNGFFNIILPLSAFSVVCWDKKIIRKFYMIVAVGISLVTMFLSESSTGLFCYLVFLILISLRIKQKTFFKLYKYIIYVCILISVLVTVFRIQEYFADIIYNWFGKSATLTGRVFIWDTAFEMIKEKPIIGYGLNIINGVILQGKTLYYSHNMLIEIIISGGIVSLSAFIYMLFVLINSVRKIKESSKSEYCILSALITYMIVWIMEAPLAINTVYLLIITGYYFSKTNNKDIVKED